MERPRPIEGAVVELKSIGVEGAIALRESALQTAQEMGVSGFLMVYSRTGMQETSQAVGTASPLNVKIAEAKAKTVLAVRRSTSVQRERMQSKGQTYEDFGGELGSLLGGGVAIFADEELTQFVGAITFSGGTEQQDEKICRSAVEENGLFTDLPRPSEKISTTLPTTERDTLGVDIRFFRDLPANAYNTLYRYGIRDVETLARLSDKEILGMKGIGLVTLRIIRDMQDRYAHREELARQYQENAEEDRQMAERDLPASVETLPEE